MLYIVKPKKIKIQHDPKRAKGNYFVKINVLEFNDMDSVIDEKPFRVNKLEITLSCSGLSKAETKIKKELYRRYKTNIHFELSN